MSAVGAPEDVDRAEHVLVQLDVHGCPPERVPGSVDCLWRAACPACCSTWANGAEKPLSVRELGVGGDVGLRCRNGCAEGAIRAELRLPRLSLVSADAGETRERSPDPPPRPAAAKLRRLDVARMLTTEPAPVDWLVEGVAARGALTLLAGREKEGKSMVALAVGACVLSGGGSVAGLTCRPGRVLIVDAENGESEAHRRVRALGLDARHVENIEYVEPRGFDLRGDLRELGRLLERSRPDLCILDSFRTLWGGEENSSGEVASALDPLRALLRDHNVAGVLIHHLGRRGGEYRGSSAIGASVENLLELARVEGDPDRRRRRLRNPRCRSRRRRPTGGFGSRPTDASAPSSSRRPNPTRPRTPRRRPAHPCAPRSPVAS